MASPTDLTAAVRHLRLAERFPGLAITLTSDEARCLLSALDGETNTTDQGRPDDTQATDRPVASDEHDGATPWCSDSTTVGGDYPAQRGPSRPARRPGDNGRRRSFTMNGAGLLVAALLVFSMPAWLPALVGEQVDPHLRNLLFVMILVMLAARASVSLHAAIGRCLVATEQLRIQEVHRG